MTSTVKALSQHDTLSFLKGSNCAAISAPLSPLEAAVSEVQSFASYTTGTLEMRITPEIQDCVSELRQLSMSAEFKKLGKFVQTLQRDFPTQNNRLVQMLNPAWLATHVPFCDTPEDVTEEQVQRSLWHIEVQGDYALIDGVPVWDRLEGERLDFYTLFKLYRDSRYGLIDNGDYVLCSRSMAGLASKLSIAPLLISTISRIYNWSTRCSYYDAFFEREMVRRKQLEIQLMQQDHLRAASSLLRRAMDYFEENAGVMTPKEALSMAELGFKVSRLSLGMMPDKPELGNAPSNQPLLAIYNNSTTNQADQMIQVNDQRSYGSEVERRLHEDIKDESNLLSILDVLQRSGAMNTVVRTELADLHQEKIDEFGNLVAKDVTPEGEE